jgi:signal transduction histidine kinase
VVPQDIGRVILNLINNAFYAVNERQKNEKESGYKPRVTLTTSKQADQVVIEVSDNGTGMPEQVKEKIFQPFFTTKPTGEGTGLGLSLSYDIVTKGHGGSINVSTSANQGTVFTIQLPA